MIASNYVQDNYFVVQSQKMQNVFSPLVNLACKAIVVWWFPHQLKKSNHLLNLMSDILVMTSADNLEVIVFSTLLATFLKVFFKVQQHCFVRPQRKSPLFSAITVCRWGSRVAIFKATGQLNCLQISSQVPSPLY